MKLAAPFALLALASFAVAGVGVTIAQVLASPEKFDQKLVVVTGTVADFEQRTSRAGKPYFVFRIYEEKLELKVFGPWKLPEKLTEGAKVEVSGLFRKEARSGSQVYRNEILVLPGKKPDYQIKVVKP